MAAIVLTAAGLAFAPVLLADDPPPTTTVVTSTVIATHQGRGIKWWAARAVQARKDANKRGRTIKSLRKANRAQLHLGGTGLERAFQCIHGHEGSWTDPNAPHWGGLQMDRQFMQQYGPVFYRAWGTADHWPPFIQMAVAIEAYLSGRGFHPWPNTARFCGLI